MKSMKIRIIKINAFHPAFGNLEPGSVHEVLSIESNKSDGVWGFTVRGVGENVVVLCHECYEEKEGGEA